MTATELRQLRELAKLTQQEAADLLGITRQGFGLWEKGRQAIPRLKVAGIRQILGKAAK